MKAGFGKRELTPPIGVELSGYGYYLKRQATSVRDPLYARAVAAEDETNRLMIISCDVLGLNRQIVSAVVGALAARGYSRENIIFVSIHTHTGPCLIYHEGCGEVCPEYVATVAPKLIAACEDALNDLKTVTGMKSCAEKVARPIAYNRTLRDGPVDPYVRGVLIERACAKPIAVVSYACHGVSLGRSTQISADFSSEVHRALQAEGAESIYLNGVCGDIDPLPPAQGKTREDNLRFMANTICEAFRRNLVPCAPAVRSARVRETLKLMPMTREKVTETAAHAVSKYADASEPAAKVARIWEKEMLDKPELPSTEDIACGCGQLGNMSIVALPFEAFTKTGRLIREAAHSENVMVLGCAEELLGYLPVREDIKNEAYAALESAFLYKRIPPAPGEAERLGLTIGKLFTESFR